LIATGSLRATTINLITINLITINLITINLITINLIKSMLKEVIKFLTISKWKTSK
jgi:hypothetical protein